jgi:dTDP-4-amino-4,6-dideoxygalactose transaminase
MYILGDEVAQFEVESEQLTGLPHGVACGSGTDALQLALRALGIGPGDLVATVSHTAVATVAAIELCGATPALVDIDIASMTMSSESLAALLESMPGRVKAVVPVHLYGHPSDMTAIGRLAELHGLSVVEDCAQAHGASHAGGLVGSGSDAAAYSFYPTKNLGAIGDGGLAAFRDPAVAERARLLRQYGWRDRYISEIVGFNSRLDPLQAAVLRAKLPHLDQENDRRREIAARYTAALPTSLRLPTAAPGTRHVFHQYVARTPRRDEFRRHLDLHKVPTSVLYPQAVHQQPAYAGRLPIGPDGLSSTEVTVREIVCLPIHPQLDDAALEQVIGAALVWTPSS